MTDLRQRHRAPLALVVLMLATLLSACSGAQATTATRTVPTPGPVSSADLAGVTLKVGDQKAGLQALLKASGQDKDLPYAVEWSTFTAGPPLLEAAASGAIDVGTVGNTPPIFAGAAKSPVSIVSASRGEGQGDAILVAKGSTATSLADLKGRTIAVTKGSSAHGHLLLALRKAGLQPSDVKISYVSPSDGYAALKNGAADAWAVWDPYTAAAEKEIGARILVSGVGIVNGLGFQVASNRSLADAGKNAAIADLVTRSARAYQWSASHPDEWARVYSSETGLSLDVTTVQAHRSIKRPITLDPEAIRSSQDLTDALASGGFIPASFDVSTIVDHRYDAAVAAVIGKA
ncbi:ABC transporter substrate-binding protein [Raineyella fluvialis]|uniref:Putative aliphatic sulfonates-binding protein n=1 Tax=Raineyella fluvialis TaxID=2662261 RepID=A0A5Q2F7X3_9ACTN|nr:ABC transporter substrate-binding protein [Raineyella fluvialis]QGF23070.1 aliphatic sulfonate ABC transporter substrate-binding protein [Raineyella fluvialis]